MPHAPYSRLTEALQENARLKARQGKTDSPSPAPQDDAEVHRLRALLREAEERERALRLEVDQTRQQQPSQPSPQAVKTEEPEFFLRMPGGLDIGSPEPMVQDRRVFSTKEKERHGGPGLSLMVSPSQSSVIQSQIQSYTDPRLLTLSPLSATWPATARSPKRRSISTNSDLLRAIWLLCRAVACSQ